MATGSFNLTKSSGDSYLIGMISWSSTPNVSGNYSDVKATIYVRKDNDDMKLTIPTSGKWSYSLTINGSTVSGTTSKNVLTDWVELTTHTVSKVSHSADGSKTITISGSVTGPSGTSMEGKVTSGSKSVAMDTIPRTSTVTATNANIGGTTTITINRAASSFTHTLTYAFAGLTGTIATKTTGTSIAWTVPTTFYAKIPNAQSGTCTITCTTYSGTTAIGTSTCTFTATAAVASCAPTVSVTAVDTNTDVIALTGSNKRIVKGFSDVKVTTTATAKNSATISSVDVYCGSAKKTGTSVTFAGAESASILATATDSRGYHTTATATGLTLVNYIVPTIKETISRESPTSDTVNISVSGNWFNGSFGAKANTLKVQVRYKPKSQASYADTDDYVNMTVTTSGNTYTATLSLPGLEYTKAYSIRIRVSDAIHVYDGALAEPIYKNTEISKGVPVFDWGEDDFKFNVPVILPKSYYYDDEKTRGHGGLDVNNSDIVGLNNLLFRDKSDGPGESIRFYKDGTNWDCLYVIDGVVYITPNYPANTKQFVIFHPDNKPYYEAGDSVTVYSTYPGWVSGGSKEFYLSIPLSKPVLASTISVSGSVVGRGINGYVLGSNTTRIDLAGGTGYSVEVVKQPDGLKLDIIYEAAQTSGITNNTPINWYGEVTITFS